MSEYDDDEKDKRTEILTLRLTENEMDLIRSEAKRRRTKVADYCRYAMIAMIGQTRKTIEQKMRAQVAMRRQYEEAR